MKIAIIGTGNLGKSIAKGLIANNAVSSLYLTKRNLKLLSEFEGTKAVSLTSDNTLAIKNSEVLIFAVQPSQIENILKDMTPFINENHVIISTVTGYSIAKVEAIVGKDKYVMRAMPNTAISVGQSMTCVAANNKGKEKIKLALDIFNRLGHSLEIPEEKIQAATVICASGIAFWMRLIRATTQGAIQLGFEAHEAQELAGQTCYGAASLLIQSGKHPEQEIDRVTTPMGCTIEGLNEMEHQGLSSSLIKGIVTSFEKINQIKNN